MKKLLILVLMLGLVFSLSCKKGAEKKEEAKPKEEITTKPSTTQPTTQPPQQLPGPRPPKEGKIIEPDKFTKMDLERLKLHHLHKSKLLEILKSAQKKDEKLLASLRKWNQEIFEKFQELQKKNNVTVFDIRKTKTDPESKKALEEYLNNHPEITKEMQKIREDVSKTNKQISDETMRLGVTVEELYATEMSFKQSQQAKPTGATPEKTTTQPASPAKTTPTVQEKTQPGK